MQMGAEPLIPSETRVVIVGGGIAGTSVAYHLAALGWTEGVLLEQGRLAGGTTWHAAGMVTRLRVSSSMMRINQASATLYAELAGRVGHDVGWRQVGSLVVARSRDRMIQYHRTTAMARFLGVECHELSPRDCGERFPGMRWDDLEGGYWIPHDGRCLPAELPVALARGAANSGMLVVEGIRVDELVLERGRVVGVRWSRRAPVAANDTAKPSIEKGEIRAERVVLCGGMWTRELAAKAGVSIPLHPVEHHYVVSHPMPGITGGLPCTRDMDGSIYFRGEDVEGGGAIVLGAFQESTKPWDVDRIPEDFSFRLLEPDWEKFTEPAARAVHRLPELAKAGWQRFVNGPESFTPDNQWLMGETAGIRGLFVLAGFNSAGIASAGGAGQALAEWIVDDAMPFDLTSVDIRRFGAWADDKSFLRARVTEALGLHYRMAWPNREFATGRGRRLSPLHRELTVAGACFGVKGGWERANWFARTDPECAREPRVTYGFGKQNWFANQAFEHRACRERVALFDQSGFGKLLATGNDALACLQHLACNDLDAPPGRVVYTGLLNERGGYESDLTIARLAADTFLIVTGSAQTDRDADWIRRHAPVGREFRLTDVSADFAVIGVMGPRSRELLTRVSEADFSTTAFPFGTCRSVTFRGVPEGVVGLRMTYVGELGWEFFVPAGAAASLYRILRDAGADLGIADAGHYAIQSLRLEKGFRAFGAELSPDETPLEAGLGFTVAWDKPGGFLGREALLRRRETGLRKRLVQFVLERPEAVLWGAEPIFRDGVAVGYTSSGAYGHTVGAAVAMGYVRHPGGSDVATEWVLAGRHEILTNGEKVPAKVSIRPWLPRTSVG